MNVVAIHVIIAASLFYETKRERCTQLALIFVALVDLFFQLFDICRMALVYNIVASWCLMEQLLVNDIAYDFVNLVLQGWVTLLLFDNSQTALLQIIATWLKF